MHLEIEKMVYGGDGLARLPADENGRGKAVFVPFVLASEKIEATLAEQKPGFARATLNRILESSPHRIVPACPYFAQCGGCNYQHSSYEHQLEVKKEILRENLRRIAKIDLPVEIQVHPSPPWNYRNRSRLQIQTAPEFAVGYFRFSSHKLLPIEQCPISSPLINKGIAALWQTGSRGSVPEGVREIEFFADVADERLLVSIFCSLDGRRSALKSWAEHLPSTMPAISGITVFRAAQPSTHPSSASPHEPLFSLGDSHHIYKIENASYRVTAGSFFQVNRHLIDELVRIVTRGQSGELAVDFYAGVGLFSTALARDFRHLFSVESSQTAMSDLSYNLPQNGKAVQATTEQYLNVGDTGEAGNKAKNRLRSGQTALPGITGHPDLVVVDPPRSGLGERVSRAVASLHASRIAYVSCDPATLARDLALLLASGYRIERVHLVDLFPQTYHLETVVRLAR